LADVVPERIDLTPESVADASHGYLRSLLEQQQARRAVDNPVSSTVVTALSWE
jgi:hypothetical protein